MKNNRNTKGAAEGRPSILLHIVVIAVVVAVVAADSFASLSAVVGTASSGLALCLSTSAPRVNAVADAAAAGPVADAEDSSRLPPGSALDNFPLHPEIASSYQWANILPPDQLVQKGNQTVTVIGE